MKEAEKHLKEIKAKNKVAVDAHKAAVTHKMDKTKAYIKAKRELEAAKIEAQRLKNKADDKKD